MNTERARVGWGFWLWWVLASTVGFAVAFAVFEAVPEAVGFAVRMAVGGASVGIAQWLVLRQQVSRAGWWVLASSVGLGVGLLVVFGVSPRGFVVAEAVAFAVRGVVGGAVGGIAQWLVLRRQVSRAGWWVLASIVGFAVTLAVAGTVGGTQNRVGAVGWAVGGGRRRGNNRGCPGLAVATARCKGITSSTGRRITTRWSGPGIQR